MKRIHRIITLMSFVLSLTPSLGQQKGKATYYSKKVHGRNTASGVVYHNDSLTCAHKSYPFGTRLLVRNTNNNKQVVVTVTDRGPYRRHFVIDLSYAAAKLLDMVGHGIASVEISKYDSIPDLSVK
jgi:rare lipoprotein A